MAVQLFGMKTRNGMQLLTLTINIILAILFRKGNSKRERISRYFLQLTKEYVEISMSPEVETKELCLSILKKSLSSQLALRIVQKTVVQNILSFTNKTKIRKSKTCKIFFAVFLCKNVVLLSFNHVWGC